VVIVDGEDWCCGWELVVGVFFALGCNACRVAMVVGRAENCGAGRVGYCGNVIVIVTLVMVVDRLLSTLLSLSIACRVDNVSCWKGDISLELGVCAVQAIGIGQGWMAAGGFVGEWAGLVVGRLVKKGLLSLVAVVIGHRKTGYEGAGCEFGGGLDGAAAVGFMQVE